MVKEYAGLTSVNVREVNRSFETIDKAERGIQLLTQELTTVWISFFIGCTYSCISHRWKKSGNESHKTYLNQCAKESTNESINVKFNFNVSRVLKLHSEWRISFVDKLTELCNDDSHAAYIKWSIPNSIISFIPDKFQVRNLQQTNFTVIFRITTYGTHHYQKCLYAPKIGRAFCDSWICTALSKSNNNCHSLYF